MKPKIITIHCSDTPNGLHVDIETLRKNHREQRGFDDVGYHGIINPSGQWDDGRPMNVVGAHVSGHNTANIGICLIGADKFTSAQLWKLKEKVEEIQRSFFLDKWDVYTHNQFDTAIHAGKCCPSMSVNRVLTFLLTGDLNAVKQHLLEAK